MLNGGTSATRAKTIMSHLTPPSKRDDALEEKPTPTDPRRVTITHELEAALNNAKPHTYVRKPVSLPPVVCGLDCSRRARCGAASVGGVFGCLTHRHSPDLEMRRGVISSPEQLFGDMLHVPASPDCPNNLKGLWWQRDGTDIGTLVTWHDAAWEAGGKFAYKRQLQSWSIVPSALGYAYMTPLRHDMAIDVSPSGDWVLFDGFQWAFKVKDGDAILMNADGSPSVVRPGDWVRVNYADAVKPKREEITWMYLFQQVATLDPSSGGVVTAEAYRDLLQRATMPTVDQLSHRLACCTTKEQREALDLAQSDEQVYFVPAGAPPVPQAMSRGVVRV